MNISYTYKIVWFENEADWRTSLEEKLRDQFEESNIQIEIVPLQSLADVEKIDASTEIDLLLMDFHLADAQGNDLIVALREKNVLCSIIFYSQDTSFANTLKETEGVHTTARNNVGSELAKCVNECGIIIGDVSSMRGRFITGAVDLEEKMNEIVSNYLASPNDDFLRENLLQAEFFNTMAKKKVVTRISDALLAGLKTKRDGSTTVEEKEALERTVTKLESTKSVFKKYDEEIIQVRNTLAHSKHYVGGENETIFLNKVKGEPYVIDEKWIRDKLAHMTKHSINLERLRSFL